MKQINKNPNKYKIKGEIIPLEELGHFLEPSGLLAYQRFTNNGEAVYNKLDLGEAFDLVVKCNGATDDDGNEICINVFEGPEYEKGGDFRDVDIDNLMVKNDSLIHACGANSFKDIGRGLKVPCYGGWDMDYLEAAFYREDNELEDIVPLPFKYSESHYSINANYAIDMFLGGYNDVTKCLFVTNRSFPYYITSAARKDMSFISVKDTYFKLLSAGDGTVTEAEEHKMKLSVGLHIDMIDNKVSFKPMRLFTNTETVIDTDYARRLLKDGFTFITRQSLNGSPGIYLAEKYFTHLYMSGKGDIATKHFNVYDTCIKNKTTDLEFAELCVGLYKFAFDLGITEMPIPIQHSSISAIKSLEGWSLLFWYGWFLDCFSRERGAIPHDYPFLEFIYNLESKLDYGVMPFNVFVKLTKTFDDDGYEQCDLTYNGVVVNTYGMLNAVTKDAIDKQKSTETVDGDFGTFLADYHDEDCVTDFEYISKGVAEYNLPEQSEYLAKKAEADAAKEEEYKYIDYALNLKEEPKEETEEEPVLGDDEELLGDDCDYMYDSMDEDGSELEEEEEDYKVKAVRERANKNIGVIDHDDNTIVLSVDRYNELMKKSASSADMIDVVDELKLEIEELKIMVNDGFKDIKTLINGGTTTELEDNGINDEAIVAKIQAERMAKTIIRAKQLGLELDKLGKYEQFKYSMYDLTHSYINVPDVVKTLNRDDDLKSINMTPNDWDGYVSLETPLDVVTENRVVSPDITPLRIRDYQVGPSTLDDLREDFDPGTVLYGNTAIFNDSSNTVIHALGRFGTMDFSDYIEFLESKPKTKYFLDTLKHINRTDVVTEHMLMMESTNLQNIRSADGRAGYKYFITALNAYDSRTMAKMNIEIGKAYPTGGTLGEMAETIGDEYMTIVSDDAVYCVKDKKITKVRDYDIEKHYDDVETLNKIVEAEVLEANGSSVEENNRKILEEFGSAMAQGRYLREREEEEAKDREKFAKAEEEFKNRKKKEEEKGPDKEEIFRQVMDNAGVKEEVNKPVVEEIKEPVVETKETVVEEVKEPVVEEVKEPVVSKGVEPRVVVDDEPVYTRFEMLPGESIEDYKARAKQYQLDNAPADLAERCAKRDIFKDLEDRLAIKEEAKNDPSIPVDKNGLPLDFKERMRLKEEVRHLNEKEAEDIFTELFTPTSQKTDDFEDDFEEPFDPRKVFEEFKGVDKDIVDEIGDVVASDPVLKAQLEAYRDKLIAKGNTKPSIVHTTEIPTTGIVTPVEQPQPIVVQSNEVQPGDELTEENYPLRDASYVPEDERVYNADGTYHTKSGLEAMEEARFVVDELKREAREEIEFIESRVVVNPKSLLIDDFDPGKDVIARCAVLPENRITTSHKRRTEMMELIMTPNFMSGEVDIHTAFKAYVPETNLLGLTDKEIGIIVDNNEEILDYLQEKGYNEYLIIKAKEEYLACKFIHPALVIDAVYAYIETNTNLNIRFSGGHLPYTLAWASGTVEKFFSDNIMMITTQVHTARMNLFKLEDLVTIYNTVTSMDAYEKFTNNVISNRLMKVLEDNNHRVVKTILNNEEHQQKICNYLGIDIVNVIDIVKALRSMKNEQFGE